MYVELLAIWCMAHEQSRIGTYTLNLAVNVTLTITYITSLSLVECDSC